MRRKTIKRNVKRAAAPCRHRAENETDWLGRTYIGCPVCRRWKLVKPHAAVPDHRRWAA